LDFELETYNMENIFQKCWW